MFQRLKADESRLKDSYVGSATSEADKRYRERRKRPEGICISRRENRVYIHSKNCTTGNLRPSNLNVSIRTVYAYVGGRENEV